MNVFVSLLLILLLNSSFVIVRSHSLPVLQDKKLHSPVVFVPGDGGSRMEAQIHKTTAPCFYCFYNWDWYDLWLNLNLLLPFIRCCWIDNIKLYYDNNTHTTHNTPGVETRIPGGSDPEVVEWLDTWHYKVGAYFNDISNELVNQLGYERRKNLLGAPYDFRKAPNELGGFFINLKTLVEKTYESNNQTSITFITHSLGSVMTLVFLQRQTTDWKSKYVQRQISLAGAWGGSVKAVKVFAMGNDLDSLALSASELKEEEISFPSTAWLLPSPLLWKPSEVLVETPERVYTMAQLESFLNDINERTAWQMRKDNLYFSLNFSPPDVELHCLYGDGLPTVERLRYKSNKIINEIPELITGLGDGTVNQRSLHTCHYWLGYQSSNITNMPLNGVDHMGILHDGRVTSFIVALLKT